MCYVKCMRGIAKAIFFKKCETIYEEQPTDNEPGVYLANHSGANGPANMTLWFAPKHKTWMIHYVVDKKKNANYIFHDFFFGKSRKCRWFWRLLSKVVAVMLRPLLLASDIIPVYHDSKIMDTFKESISEMKNGNNLVIFPECPTKFSEYISEVYNGFADIGRMYYNETGKKLKFYPTYVAHSLRKIMVGKPIEYDPSIPPKPQRIEIGNYIRDNIDRLARSLPEHECTPFLPEVWYKYYGEYVNNIADYWKMFD